MFGVSFFEIQVDYLERARSFYGKVFGWKFTKQEGLPIEYWHIDTDDAGGGMLQRPAPRPQGGMGTNAYVCSMQVADYDETEHVILQNGGQIALPKFAVPGKCWQGYYLDPEGNTFGIFQVDSEAK
jgi:predicted enzyme related to lactoylglutathione lyase